MDDVQDERSDEQLILVDDADRDIGFLSKAIGVIKAAEFCTGLFRC